MEEEKKIGRPSIFTQELADEICAELAEGKSIRTVCAPEGKPSIQTFFRWLREKESFREQYARAKEEASDALVEEMLDISDDSLPNALENITEKGANAVVQAHKLKVDTRKWIASKLKPKKYGEKLDVTSDNKPIPLLYAVSNNNRNGESPKPEETA